MKADTHAAWLPLSIMVIALVGMGLLVQAQLMPSNASEPLQERAPAPPDKSSVDDGLVAWDAAGPSQSPELDLSYKSGTAVVQPGGLLTYTLVITNSGYADATDVVIHDPLPDQTAMAAIIQPPNLLYNPNLNRVEWAGTVSAGEAVTLTFAVTVEASACQTPVTNTATISAGAQSTPVVVEHIAQVWNTVYYVEDFELGAGGYTTSGLISSWEWGSIGPYEGYPVNVPPGAHSGNRAWATNLTGDYRNDEDSALTSPPIDLRAADYVPGYPVYLQWWQWLAAESAIYDWGEVEIRNAEQDWLPLDPPGQMGGEHSLPWTPVRVDISRFAGTADVQVRFRFQSDGSVEYPGWYIDDITIVQCPVSPGVYLEPSELSLGACAGVTQTHRFELYNWSGSGDDVEIAYGLDPTETGILTGPSSVALDDQAHAGFVVTFSPEICLPDSLAVVGSIRASSGGYTSVSTLTKSLHTGTMPLWYASEPLPTGTRFHAAAYHDGYVYRIGGETGWWQPTSAVQRYDTVGGRWEAVSALPSGRYGIDAAVLDDKIYVPGGSDDDEDTGDGGTFLDDLLIYDPGSDVWTTGASLPMSRTYASAVALGGKLYVLGGQDDSGAYQNSVFIYDPQSNSWSTGSPMSQARGYAASGVVGTKIYVAGGFGGGSTTLDSVEIYDPATDVWTAGPDLPASWAPYAAAVVQDRYLVVANGDTISYDYGTNYSCGAQAYVLDTMGEEWQALSLLDQCLYGAAMTGSDRHAYVISGRSSLGGWHMAPEVSYLGMCPECDALGWLRGTVYDYDSVAPACALSTVHLEPGSSDVSARGDGVYSSELAPYDYQVTASSVGYPQPAGPVGVRVERGLTVTLDFFLDRPDMVLLSTPITAAIDTGHTTSVSIEIQNPGSLELAFTLREVTPDGTGGAGEARSQTEPAADIQIEPALLAELEARGSNGYLIYLRDRPDLSAATYMSWQDRGRFVVQALKETARRSQAPVRQVLDSQGVAYRAFWIDNVIAVESSSRQVLDQLVSLGEIEALRTRKTPILYEPEQREAETPHRLGVSGLLETPEANISHIGADQVWAWGVRGEGIVVANIDTGVRYSHEALVDHYRGNLGGGSFDHNHNWWDPALGGSDPVPNDSNGHGSHTMGIMVGSDGEDNQVGVAPGAMWIACQAFEGADDELLECAEFMAAPWDLSGANPSPDLRPHVVNNSWGDCLDYADHWFDGAIDSWHALGIYPVFSNGNASNCGYTYPPGCNTLGNPARAGHVTAVGSSGKANGLYATHATWGPTDDLDTVNPQGYATLKPQVVAPGVSIRSAFGSSDATYGQMTGTSMSAPHVSGLVALMWSAAPCLIGDYATTETLIQETARPIAYDSACGGEGPGNVPNQATGWGEIDAPAAVRAAQSYCNVDVLPWVRTSVSSGTLASGSSVGMDLLFTCTLTAALEAQPLEGILQISHNDPCQDSIEVPLSLTCSAEGLYLPVVIR